MPNNLMAQPRIAAVVPAAGIGSRMGAEIPKQYLCLNDEPIISLTIKKLLQHALIELVVVALSRDDIWFHDLPISKHPKVRTVTGGQNRADSVLNGLNFLDESLYDWVLVHDAARPCLTLVDLNVLIYSCLESGVGGILAYPAHDTMKRADGQNVSHTECRDDLWHALTPQMFKTKTLKRALVEAAKEGANITDEASAIEFVGGTCRLINASSLNIKITRPDDLVIANMILKTQECKA